MSIDQKMMEEGIRIKKCSILKEHIDDYLREKQYLSLQNVSEKSHVPISTLRRINNLEGNPGIETVAKIFKALGGDAELLKYMEKFHPGIYDVMIQRTRHNQEFNFVDKAHLKYFTNEDSFLIVTLAFTRAGISEKEVAHEIGERGVELLQKLYQEGLLKKDGQGRYFGGIEKYKLPIAQTKKRLEMSLKYYRVEEAFGKKNWLSYETESLNEEGAKALKILMQEQFEERKNKIFYNPKYYGEIKVFAATIASTFFPDNSKEERC